MSARWKRARRADRPADLPAQRSMTKTNDVTQMARSQTMLLMYEAMARARWPEHQRSNRQWPQSRPARLVALQATLLRSR
jgi:hypothetical protein